MLIFSPSPRTTQWCIYHPRNDEVGEALGLVVGTQSTKAVRSYDSALPHPPVSVSELSFDTNEPPSPQFSSGSRIRSKCEYLHRCARSRTGCAPRDAVGQWGCLCHLDLDRCKTHLSFLIREISNQSTLSALIPRFTVVHLTCLRSTTLCSTPKRGQLSRGRPT